MIKTGMDWFLWGRCRCGVLEELEHAKQRGAVIYAELVRIRFYGRCYHITSPAEDGSGAGKAMELAMEEGGM